MLVNIVLYTIGVIIILVILITIIFMIKRISVDKKRTDSNEDFQFPHTLKEMDDLNEKNNDFEGYIKKESSLSNHSKINTNDVENNNFDNKYNEDIPIKYDRAPFSDEKYIAMKVCPKCKNKLINKINSYDDSHFLGCSQYRQTGCSFTLNYHEYYRIVNKIKI